MTLNAKKGKKSIGFSYAWNGLVQLAKCERNFKIHIFVMVLVIIINIILKISVTEWAIVMLTTGSVLITETFNTCMEWLIDYVKPDIHPTAKRIKDVAAGGVLIATIISVIIGFLIYLPKIISFF